MESYGYDKVEATGVACQTNIVQTVSTFCQIDKKLKVLQAKELIELESENHHEQHTSSKSPLYSNLLAQFVPRDVNNVTKNCACFILIVCKTKVIASLCRLVVAAE